MQLSYISRVICLALCSAGLLEVALEWTAWAVAPALLRNRRRTARQEERTLLRLLLAARLMPWLLVFGLLVPAYLRGEDNPSSEHVGVACLAGAACVLLVSLLGIARVLAAAWSVQRCCRGCHAGGRSPNNLPLLLYGGQRSLMAVAGVFSPRLIVSQTLLDASRFPAAALDVALAHEAAHVRHHDNLKLLLLSLFPHVPASTRARPSLQQRWRLAVELAADEEGTQGEPARSLLLAQLLVAMAREGTRRLPQGAAALVGAPEHLRIRVERLLSSPCSTQTTAVSDSLPQQARHHRLRGMLPLAASAMLLAGLASACFLFGHRAAEFLLHLG